MSEPDLAQMLRDLAAAGWKPVLYAETDGASRVKEWACYPQGNVRWWQGFRAPDPVGAARGLWSHARAHPNEPPQRWRDETAPVGRCGNDEAPTAPTPQLCAPVGESPPPETSTAGIGRGFLTLFGGGKRRP